MGTHKKTRYAIIYGRLIEYYERPAQTSRLEKYREPKRVFPIGFKGRYKTKALAQEAAKEWEAM